MEVVLLKKAKKDRDYWKQTGNEKIMKRITALLKDIESIHLQAWVNQSH